MTRLEAMKQAIMTGRSIVPAAAVVQAQPALRRQPGAGEVIRTLRAALAAERKARLDAEARLRRVLAAVASRKATTVAPPPPAPPPAVETKALPPAPEVLEPDEVIEPDGTVFQRIYEASAGEDDHGEEDY